MSRFDDILTVISRRGQNPVVGNMYTKMAEWKSWYRGNVNDFHRYNVNVGGTNVQVERTSLQMAKKGCEDWATLLFNEEVTMNVKDNDTLNDRVQEVLSDNNFREEFSGLLEKSFALGTGVLVEFVNNGKVMIDYITGDLIIITSYRNQKVNGICTVNAFKRGDSYITHLTFHDHNDKTYTIENVVFESDTDQQLGRVTRLENVFDRNAPSEIVQFNVSTPHFQVIKPNIVNNFELENPLGVSIFANSISTLMAIDKKYDSFDDETDAARFRILVDSEMTKTKQEVSEDGTNIVHIKYFDKKQLVYQSIPMGENPKDPIRFYNPALRTEDHIKGLNYELQAYGFKLGFGTDYYAFDARGVYQNEKAIVSENSDLWATKEKHEIILTKVLKNLIKSIAFLLSGRELEDDMIEIGLSDSIIIDDEAEYQKDKELMEMGLMPEVDFLVKWKGLTTTEAEDWIARAKKPSFTELEFDEEVPDDVDGGEEE